MGGRDQGPGAQRGRKPRWALKRRKDWLPALTAGVPDLTLEQTVERIDRELGLTTSISAQG
jgi:hypothetical protein